MMSLFQKMFWFHGSFWGCMYHQNRDFEFLGMNFQFLKAKLGGFWNIFWIFTPYQGKMIQFDFRGRFFQLDGKQSTRTDLFHQRYMYLHGSCPHTSLTRLGWIFTDYFLHDRTWVGVQLDDFSFINLEVELIPWYLVVATNHIRVAYEV